MIHSNYSNMFSPDTWRRLIFIQLLINSGAILLQATTTGSIITQNNFGLVNTNNTINMNNQTQLPILPTSQAANALLPQGKYIFKMITKDNTPYLELMSVNPPNLHEPRIEFRYQTKYPGYVSMPENSPNNTVVAAVLVQDEDGNETSLSIEAGNELGHFKLVCTGHTNTVQVNGPLARHRVPEYNLTIVARDHGTPPKSSSSNLVIKVHPAPNWAPSLGPDQPSGPKPPVTDLMYVGTMLVLMFAAVVILIIFGCALVQRPQKANKHTHKGQPPTRTTSATNSRIIAPTDQCSAYCLSTSYNL